MLERVDLFTFNQYKLISAEAEIGCLPQVTTLIYLRVQIEAAGRNAIGITHILSGQRKKNGVRCKCLCFIMGKG